MLLALLLANLVTLDSTAKILELTTSSTSAVDCVVSYTDTTTTAFTPGSTPTAITTATTTTILAAPAASTQRAVSRVTCTNKGAAANNLTLKLDVSATEYALTPITTLAPGYSMQVDNAGAVTTLATGGGVVTQPADTTGYNGMPISFVQKVGTTPESVAVRYLFLKDTGNPGAWVPGTPGLNGDALDCSTAGDASIAGTNILPAPTTGNWFIGSAAVSMTVAHFAEIYDLVWYNTGLVVGTTAEQAITQPTLPARDANGTNNGEGWIAGIYVTTTGTAGAITNTTLNYTDSDGNAGNTATIASFPASPLLGTFVPFELAAGDRGVRSIQGITLGTAYTTATISLLHARPLVPIPSPTVNTGDRLVFADPGVRVYPGSCLMPGFLTGTATATTAAVNILLQER